MYDVRFWLWLSLIFETGSPLCDSLLNAFNHNPKSIYEADKDSLSPFCKNNDYILTKLLDKRLNRVYSVLDFCQKENIGILTPESRNFPSSLLKIPSQPLVLYYKGRLPDFGSSLGVAVVGTRSVTPYGSSAAYTISHDLASAGAIVVSGMASGADTAAHRGALDAGGHTVAFLGCGIDIIYPKDNARLMQEIISVGTVITEYAPGLKPEGRHFPIRNRLISGIGSAVLVIEAAKKSGALITASHGLRQGKLIYAVPGKVGELSSTGTNLLIQNGAKMVTSARDIISDFSGLYEFKLGQGQKNNVQNFKNTETGAARENVGVSSDNFNSGRSASERANFTNTDFSKNSLNGVNPGNSDFDRVNSGNTDFSKNSFDRANPGNSDFDRVNSGNTNFSRGSFDRATPVNDNYGTANTAADNFSRDNFNSASAVNNGFVKEPLPEKPFGNIIFENHVSDRRPERLVAAQPRPIILYNGMTEDEVAASYMSMETEIGIKAPPHSQDTERVYLTYPKEPMPKDGYQIALSEEGLKNFESEFGVSFKTEFSETDSFIPITPYKIENDPIKAVANKKAEKKKKLSFKRIKSDADEKASTTDKKSDKNKITDTPKATQKISYEGLNEMESALLKFIFEEGSVGVDGMAALNIPVSKLLATVTMLEIKQKITQKPGGYFEIK